MFVALALVLLEGSLQAPVSTEARVLAERPASPGDVDPGPGSEDDPACDAPGATTFHLFPAPSAPVGGGTLQLIAEGNCASGSATAIGGGASPGSVGNTGSACGLAAGFFPLDSGRLAGLAAGGAVAIRVENGPAVGIDCPMNRHTVRLGYSPETGTLDFGVVAAGTSKELPLNIVNGGTAVLHVSSMASDAAEFAIAPTTLNVDPDEAGSATITVTPTGAGGFSGTLSIAGDDPDRRLASIQLLGEGS